MYKKITHNITEEHFNHPMATQIKKAVDKISPKPKIQAFESASTLRTSIDDYFTTYLNNMDALIACIKKPDADLQAAQIAAFATVDTIGNLIKPYYNFEFSEKLNASLKGYILIMTNYIRSLSNQTDTALWQQRIDGINGDIAFTLGTYNALFWQFIAVKDTWKSISDNWIKQVKALAANDTATATTAKDEARQKTMAFSNLFSSGIIQQRSDSFLYN